MNEKEVTIVRFAKPENTPESRKRTGKMFLEGYVVGLGCILVPIIAGIIIFLIVILL